MLSRRSLVENFAPKGLEDSAQGFNPGLCTQLWGRAGTWKKHRSMVRQNTGWKPMLLYALASPLRAKNACLYLARFPLATAMRVAGVERPACRNSVRLISTLCGLRDLCAMLSPQRRSRTEAPYHFAPSL
jgi:hypothetical protein